ncbi:hypothetical protein RHRU231_750107 [Rhodococcus ruber]|uniref:Uncharacterized protein n=1 Tax=Rhodococcus ruber TaxID=1830 RepID=A0A098BRB6_9NOCA|nr:hypothetical protein RHRU231_750107 [Rhodococcus ruber]
MPHHGSSGSQPTAFVPGTDRRPDYVAGKSLRMGAWMRHGWRAFSPIAMPGRPPSARSRRRWTRWEPARRC